MTESASTYAEGAPMPLCILYLEQAAHEAERAVADPQRWFFAVPEMHRGLGCALVAALAGSAEIGAYSDKLQQKWITHFEDPNWSAVPGPEGDRIQEVSRLLARAQDAAELEMQGRPVVLTEAQRNDLVRLNDIRGDMEHVKPGSWSIETTGLPRILAAAAEVIRQLLHEPRCRTAIEEEDEVRAEQAIARINALAVASPAGAA